MPWRDKPQAFVEVQKIEQDEHQPDGVAAVGSRLDHAEGGDAGPERRHGCGDYVQSRPVQVSRRTPR